jgi:ribosomal protein L24
MIASRQRLFPWALGAALAWAVTGSAILCTSAQAQADTQTHTKSTPTSISRTEKVTERVTVKSVDVATRHVTVTKANGDTVSFKAPPEIRNLAQLKPGDKISATYTVEAEFVLSAPNAPLPPDTETTMTARAAKGEVPAGAVANHIVVSGAVVAVDMAKHTIKLVSPQGGEVHTLNVKSADGRKAMANVKVGDKITAYITESLLVAAHPA